MPIHSDSSVPVLLFNVPVPVHGFWLTCWGNKNLVLVGTGEGESSYWGILFRVGGISKFLGACPHPLSGIENPG